MKKLYDKSEVTFAIIWIIAFVVIYSIAESISVGIGIHGIISAPMLVIMSLILILWTGKHALYEKYGLKPQKIDYKRYLYFLPFLIICTTNLWAGVALNFSILETVLYAISLISIGFIEEFIFRGLLFTALKKNGIKVAIIISSLTFGMGHIMNLLNGAPIFETLSQICYATAIGFLFAIIFYKSNNLYPCIIAHASINVLSIFAGEGVVIIDIISKIVLIVVPVFYAIWILKKCK